MTSTGPVKRRIAYIVHDLNDPAVHRRVAMFEAGGASVVLLGFYRGATPSSIGGRPVVALGRTLNANLRARAVSVIRALFTLPVWAGKLAGAEVLVARNLETLLLAAAGRLFSLVPAYAYEMLDVHRMMTGAGAASRLMRTLEGRLLRSSSAVIVSSPAFVSAYLAPVHPRLPPIHLVENKIFQPGDPDPSKAATSPAAPPWRIGWFGNLRCRVSLDTLIELARALGPKVEVHLRGVIAKSIEDVFEERTAGLSNVHYHGAYRNPESLADIYAGVHFAWAIDFYEAQLNSAWLLPNRLYEGCAFGTVPIALKGVETGAWLQRHGLGVLNETPQADIALIADMDRQAYDCYAQAVRASPQALFKANTNDCQLLVSDLLRDAASHLSRPNGKATR